MGQALAGAFLRAGHPTTVWNRTPARADTLVAQGAVCADTVARAVAASPVVIVCVIDYDAVHAIVDPVADQLAGRVLVNLTSDSPDRARTTAAWAADRRVDYLDGSIMTPTTTIGGPAALVLYSGPAEVYARSRAVLASIGGSAAHLGADPGRAAAHDVALLDLFWTTMSGLTHAFALARAEGITAADLAPYAAGIVGLLTGQGVIADFAANVDAGTHPGTTSAIDSAAAGMRHIAHAARSRGIDTGVLDAALAVADRAIDTGHGGDAFSRLVDVLSPRSA
ncbi:6-phosphogluconate dehydrogenase [Actinokineospora sp. NBRC 105648]|nr:6-phosphogluconate dehydrogenase [Actinokineospora sp. NBRC 105648]